MGIRRFLFLPINTYLKGIKPYHNFMKKHPLTTAVIIVAFNLLFQSCHFGTTCTWKNGNIDPDIKNTINLLNKKLIQDIKAGDIAGVKQLMSTVLLDSAGSKIDTLVNKVGFTSDDFGVVDEYYSKNSTTNIANTLISNNGNINDYEVDYLALNKEMYTSLLVPKNESSNGIMLVCYGKYDNSWKINVLYVGVYKQFGKTAPEYFDLAQQEYKKGNIINAADFIIVAKDIAKPLSTYFKYKNEDDMKGFYTKLLSEANTQYHFPIVLDKIKNSPQIFAVSPSSC
jgi:hypothetical protein